MAGKIQYMGWSLQPIGVAGGSDSNEWKNASRRVCTVEDHVQR